MEKGKKFYTEDEVLDEFIGKVGTPERDEFEAKLKKEVDEYFIGEAIKETLKKQGLTQEELGERMGVWRFGRLRKIIRSLRGMSLWANSHIA